jgi:hypothetical protein
LGKEIQGASKAFINFKSTKIKTSKRTTSSFMGSKKEAKGNEGTDGYSKTIKNCI